MSEQGQRSFHFKPSTLMAKKNAARHVDRYFAYDGASGEFSTFPTASEALAFADEALDLARENAAEGWDECAQNICVGELRGIVAMSERRPATRSEQLNLDVEEFWDFALVALPRGEEDESDA